MNTLTAKLKKEMNEQNLLALPRIERVVVNAGVGKRVVAEGEKVLEPIIKDLSRITGQKPAVRPARKSVASFKLRQGVPAGLVVTLRGRRAQDFLDRLVRTALPRTRDFRGIPSSSVDESGNLNIGIREQTIFPEAAHQPTGVLFGLQVTVVVDAQDRDEAMAIYRLLGVPFQKDNT